MAGASRSNPMVDGKGWSSGMAQTRTDEQLLKDFGAGQREALGVLALRYERLLLGLARGILSGREDLARDVVQDSWVRVIRAAKDFQGRSSVRTWLYRIVVNRAIDARARRMTPVVVNRPAGANDGGLERAEQGDRLREELDRLPGDTRLILILCYHEGLTLEQGAEVLAIPVGTLKSRLHAALKVLRERLGTEAAV